MLSKPRVLFWALIIVTLLSGCSTTVENQAMSPEEHAFACTAVQTLLQTELTSTQILQAPQLWRQQASEVLLPEHSHLLVAQSRQVPGLEQQITVYLDLIAESVALHYGQWLQTIEQWIDSLVVTSPFEIISGAPTSASTYFNDYYHQELVELISTTLAEADRLENQKVSRAWQRVEERYQIYVQAENQRLGLTMPRYQSADLFSSLGTTIATALHQLMSNEEEAIRATIVAYTDPCLKLFTTNGK